MIGKTRTTFCVFFLHIIMSKVVGVSYESNTNFNILLKYQVMTFQTNDNFILIPTIVEMHALEKVTELFMIKWIEEKIVDCHISFVNNLCGRCL
jgi:hypothetical protein